ncbi:MAG: alginate O-acetyltransferase AlgX-related protein [Rhodoglobus sp.]
MALLLASVLLVVGGVVVKRHLATLPLPAPSLSEAAAVTGNTTAGGFAQECRTPVEPPAQEPWLEGDAASAEAVWQAHLGELGEEYVLGIDGYVDWGDYVDMSLSQAIGRRVLSEVEVKAWADYISSVQTKLAAMDIPFYVVIGPTKWQVYPQKLPNWAQGIRGSGPLDQIIANHPALPIIDVRGDLRNASIENPVYSRVNSHWTDYGAVVGWGAITRCLNKVSPELGPFEDPAISSITTSSDLSEFAVYGVENPVPDWTVPVYAEPLLPFEVTKKDALTQKVDGSTRLGLLDLPLSTKTVGAQRDKSLLLVRDSMSDSMSIPVSQTFAQTWQVQHYLFDPNQTANIVELSDQLRPSVVILEFAQRYLNNPAPPPVP